jgi:hypothetical protein
LIPTKTIKTRRCVIKSDTFGHEDEINQAGIPILNILLPELHDLLDQTVTNEDYEKQLKYVMKFQNDKTEIHRDPN